MTVTIYFIMDIEDIYIFYIPLYDNKMILFFISISVALIEG